MLEKPAIHAADLIFCLQKVYALHIKTLTFLPIGADSNSAVYKAVSADNTSYFLKLRRGQFDETSVKLPQYYYDLGIKQIVPSVPTKAGHLWATLGQYTIILYPFIEGHNGYERQLSERNWAEFGHALQQIHAAGIPANITSAIRRETFSAKHREGVLGFLNQIEAESFADPVAIELVEFLKAKRPVVLNLIGQAERLAAELKTKHLENIVCHSDLHAGNLLIAPDGSLFIVDWDAPIYAPRERDLMYVGGALLASGLTPQEEELLFYAHYGTVAANLNALTYYRCERIIEDIFEYCKELLLSTEGGTDRKQSLAYLTSNFKPNHTLDAAFRLLR